MSKSDFELFPGFGAEPCASEAEYVRGQRLKRLREMYEARPVVKAEACYGAVRNWALFARCIEAFEAEIKLWRSGERHHPSLTALAWSVAGQLGASGKAVLVDFNDRKQRCYLKNGLVDFCVVLCREMESAEDLTMKGMKGLKGEDK